MIAAAQPRTHVALRTRRGKGKTPLPTVLLVAFAAMLTACGASSAGGGSVPGRAGDPARATALVAEAFGANPHAVSGIISGTISITVHGIPRFSAPVSLTTSGPFSDTAGGRLPDSDQAVGIDNYGAGLTTSGDKVFLDIGTGAYLVPAPIVGLMVKAASSAHNGLMRTVAAFDIRPDLWVRNPKIVGTTTLDGVNVVHLSANIDAARVLLDASRFTHFLTTLQVTQLAGLPEAIGPAAQAALLRSVTGAHGDLYIGASDHVLRRAVLTLALGMSPSDRALLGGIRSLAVNAQLDATQVGQPQQIHVLPDRHPYSEAKGLLGAAAYSHRTPAERVQ